MDITDWLDAEGVPEAHAARDEIERLRYQVAVGKDVVNFGLGLMTPEQVGQWVGVRHFLEAGTEMYPPFPEEDERPNVELTGAERASPAKRPR